jgi:hypothetical protein
MGWGILIGTELFTGIIFAAILIALRVSGVQWTLAIGLIVSALLALIFGLRLSNSLWRRLAEAVGFTFGPAPAATALVVGIVVVGVVFAILGLLIFGARFGASGAAGGLVLGLVVGILLGALSAISFDRRAGVGTGIALGLALWQVLMGVLVARQGVDTEDLKRRFWPDETIDTAKETIEWVRERTPLGPKS